MRVNRRIRRYGVDHSGMAESSTKLKKVERKKWKEKKMKEWRREIKGRIKIYCSLICKDIFLNTSFTTQCIHIYFAACLYTATITFSSVGTGPGDVVAAATASASFGSTPPSTNWTQASSRNPMNVVYPRELNRTLQQDTELAHAVGTTRLGPTYVLA